MGSLTVLFIIIFIILLIGTKFNRIKGFYAFLRFKKYKVRLMSGYILLLKMQCKR